MRRVLLAAALALLVPFSANATHTVTYEVTGEILIGNPNSRVLGAAVEYVSPCNGSPDPEVPPGAANGVDGHWFELPAGLEGHAATLTASQPEGAVVNDVDAWFYDEGCNLIRPAQDPNAYSMASTSPQPNFDEEGVIPAGAWYVVINLYQGANASFTFRVAA